MNFSRNVFLTKMSAIPWHTSEILTLQKLKHFPNFHIFPIFDPIIITKCEKRRRSLDGLLYFGHFWKKGVYTDPFFTSTSNFHLSMVVLNHFSGIEAQMVLNQWSIAQAVLSCFGHLLSPTNKIILKSDKDDDLME